MKIVFSVTALQKFNWREKVVMFSEQINKLQKKNTKLFRELISVAAVIGRW